MYAVIATGGKQYKVTQDEIIKIETLTAEPGTEVEFAKVLLRVDGSDIKIGTPYLPTKVVGEVVEQGRGDKIEIIKFRRRKHYMRRRGHRQNFTAVKIKSL